MSGRTAAEPNDRWLTYDLTDADARAFYRHHVWHHPSARSLVAGFAAMVPIIVGLFFLLPVVREASSAPGWTDAAAGACAGLLVYALFLWRWPSQLAHAAAKVPGFIGPHWIDLNEQGLTSATHGGAATYDWTGIDRIDATPSVILLYSSRIQAVIVPRRAFRTTAEVESFVAAARAFRDAASSMPAARARAGTPPEPAAGGFSARYALTEADVRACQLHQQFRGRGQRIRTIVLLLAMGGAGALAYGYLGFLAGAATGGLLFLVVFPWLGRRRASRIPGYLGERTVTITPEFVHAWSAGLAEGRIGWAAVTSLDATQDHFFIYTGPQRAVTVPRRAFASEEAAEQFLSQARAWKAAAPAGASRDSFAAEVVTRHVPTEGSR